MLKLASLSLAAFLSLSPASAKISVTTQAKLDLPIKVCTSPAQLTARLGKPKYDLKDGALAVFLANFAKHGRDVDGKQVGLPANIDEVLIFSDPTKPIALFVPVVTHCAIGLGGIPADALEKLVKDQKNITPDDDGAI